MATRESINRVIDIVSADDRRKFVIVSAPGKRNKCDIVSIEYEGFTQRMIEVEIVLLRTLWVKRNVGKGTPTNYSLV